MAKQVSQSVVSVQTHTNGSADIQVSNTRGTLTLEVFADELTIAIPDLERTKRLRGESGAGMYKAVVSLQANGHLRGWFVEKKGATARDDTLVFFPARKKRVTKKAGKPKA